MTTGRIVLALTFTAGTLLPSTGCLRRKETITVNPDQSVRIDVVYESGDPDFGAPDAMPSQAGGWDAETLAEKNDNGEMDYTLKASKTFAPNEPLPRNYAAPGDPDTDLYLDFPTTLGVERRKDGTVYTLRRTYTARPWAYVQYWEDRILEGDVKKLLDKPTEELNDEERERVLKAIASIEVLRRLELSHTALQRSGIVNYETGWLEARRALINHVEEIDFQPILELQNQVEAAPKGSAEKEAAQEQMERSIKEMNDTALQTFENQLAASLGDAQLAAYDQAMRRVEKQYEITKETGGHAFEIHAKMPGRVIAHNGDKIEDDGTVVWEFDGNAFRDRDHELLVISRLQSPKAETPR